MKDAKTAVANLSDEELMELYQQGDYQAFQTIYKRHSGRLLEYFRKKTTAAVAQDLLQDAFEKLHRYRDKYNSQYPFLPWIFTVSRNTLMDYFKKSETKLARSSENSEGLLENLSLNAGSFAVADFSVALENLPPNQKRAIEMRYLSDWSFAQIADELDTSEDNIRQQISRGLKKLRLSFGKPGATDD